MVSKLNKKGENPRVIRLKSCPRCKGDVLADRDFYGWYEQCLQCGHISDLPDLPPDGAYVPVRYQRDKKTLK
jgi:hypothetical protein